jgi:hypothetical protein
MYHWSFTGTHHLLPNINYESAINFSMYYDVTILSNQPPGMEGSCIYVQG